MFYLRDTLKEAHQKNYANVNKNYYGKEISYLYFMPELQLHLRASIRFGEKNEMFMYILLKRVKRFVRPRISF